MGDLQDYLQVPLSAGGTHRTQHVVLETIIYYSKRIQSKISNRKRHKGWSLEEIRHENPSSVESWRIHLKPPAVSCDSSTWNTACQEAYWGLSAHGLWMETCWLHGHPLPSMHPNTGLQREKQVCSINHGVCTNKWGTMSYSFFPKFQVPRCQPEASYRKASRPK